MNTYWGPLYLTASLFEQNHAGERGGAMSCLSVVEMEGCTLVDNHADLMGGALLLWTDPGSHVTSCTFSGNGAPTGGAVYLRDDFAVPEIRNTIIAFSTEGAAVYNEGPASVEPVCCNVYGNAGGDWAGPIAGQCGENGNISEDPLFCMESSALSPWTLQSDSSCAPENSGECGVIGAWPVDCGTSPSQATSWGRIKGLFR
ncbi:MAG: hypothetical protein GF400_02965 [Candidatus Eisenbacteria bacterium]|nr:hypothetical protein [Candidatus Eisenbacteria bacterium]